MDDGDGWVTATYAEIRAHFDFKTTDHARIHAKRKGWPLAARNHPGDIAIVRVPRAAWEAAPPPAPAGPASAADPPSGDHRGVPAVSADSGPTPALDAAGWAMAVQVLGEQLQQERGRADRNEAALRAAWERLCAALDEADRVKLSLADAARAEAEAREAEGRAQLARQEALAVTREREAAERLLAELTRGSPWRRAFRAFVYRFSV